MNGGGNEIMALEESNDLVDFHQQLVSRNQKAGQRFGSQPRWDDCKKGAIDQDFQIGELKFSDGVSSFLPWGWI